MRITGPLLKVLNALLDAYLSGEEVYGLELSRLTGVKGGTLHPLLDRLEDDGWVEARWEDVDEAVKRPRRRYYRFTAHGAHEARQALAEHGVTVPGLPGVAGMGWA